MWLTRDCAGNFDKLTQGHGKSRNAFIEIDGHTNFVESLWRDGVEGLAIGEAQASGGISEHDVFSDGHFRHEAELLVNKRNTGVDGALRPFLQHATLDPNLSSILRNHSGHHTHQRGLAGTVLAHNCVNLTAPDRKRHIVYRGGAAKTLRDRVSFKNNVSQSVARWGHSCGSFALSRVHKHTTTVAQV